MNTIKINDEHLELIQEALELYIRCSIGQFERIMDVPSIDKWYNKQDKVTQYYFNDDLKNLHYSYTGSYNGGPGIFNKKEVTDDARDAMHIHNQIRHHLWNKGDQKYKHTLAADDAMVKLIKIE